MTWNDFPWFALPALLCWVGAGIAVYKYRGVSHVLMLLGTLIYAVFIAGLWVGLERPPMRTVGETRLWYAFFLAAVGYATFRRHRYPWLLSFAALVACVFTCINLFKPEIHSKHLMPALQSYWFVPHVTVYILSYAMLGAATIGAFIRLRRAPERVVLWTLPIAFVLLMITWIGVNYLPAAQGSVHVYG